MLRQFEFEADVYQSLNCVPMAARRKLDLLGIKISLEQWQQLGRGERLMICHAPAVSAEERDALRLFINEATLAHSGSPPRPLAAEAIQGAEPPGELPLRLAANASAVDFVLTQSEWERLDNDERYALTKLGDTDRPSHNLKTALAELLGRHA
jgi:hypothetical protein